MCDENIQDFFARSDKNEHNMNKMVSKRDVGISLPKHVQNSNRLRRSIMTEPSIKFHVLE